MYGGCSAYARLRHRGCVLGVAIAGAGEGARLFGKGCIIIHGFMGIAIQITRFWIWMRVFYACIGRRACLFCLPCSAAPSRMCARRCHRGGGRRCQAFWHGVHNHTWLYGCSNSNYKVLDLDAGLLCMHRTKSLPLLPALLGCAVADVLGVAIADLCLAAPLRGCLALLSQIHVYVIGV